MNQLLTLYTVLSPVEHNGKYFKVGRPIELTDEEAEPLKIAKAIELPKAETDHPGLLSTALVEDQRHQVDDDMARANLALDELHQQLQAARVQLDQQGEALSELRDELDTAQAQLKQAEADTQSAQTAKAEAQSQLAELQTQLAERDAALKVAQAAVAAAPATAATKTAKRA